jgi:hypothetical protein
LLYLPFDLDTRQKERCLSSLLSEQKGRGRHDRARKKSKIDVRNANRQQLYAVATAAPFASSLGPASRVTSSIATSPPDAFDGAAEGAAGTRGTFEATNALIWGMLAPRRCVGRLSSSAAVAGARKRTLVMRCEGESEGKGGGKSKTHWHGKCCRTSSAFCPPAGNPRAAGE